MPTNMNNLYEILDKLEEVKSGATDVIEKLEVGAS